MSTPTTTATVDRRPEDRRRPMESVYRASWEACYEYGLNRARKINA